MSLVSLVIRIIMIMIQHFFSQPVNYIQAEVTCITVLQILVLSVEITKTFKIFDLLFAMLLLSGRERFEPGKCWLE